MFFFIYGSRVKTQKPYNNRNKDEKNNFFNRLFVPFCIGGICLHRIILDENRKIPYDLITQKLNDWYTLIKNDRVEQAEHIRKEVEKELVNMEENQDALLYYQLLEFRHEIMLSCMESKRIDDLDSAYETIKEMEEQGQLTGMLEYYYFFFTGMYEFRRKELTTAISAYRIAETKLSEVEDEIEKAEFFSKFRTFIII